MAASSTVRFTSPAQPTPSRPPFIRQKAGSIHLRRGQFHRKPEVFRQNGEITRQTGAFTRRKGGMIRQNGGAHRQIDEPIREKTGTLRQTGGTMGLRGGSFRQRGGTLRLFGAMKHWRCAEERFSGGASSLGARNLKRNVSRTELSARVLVWRGRRRGRAAWPERGRRTPSPSGRGMG